MCCDVPLGGRAAGLANKLFDATKMNPKITAVYESGEHKGTYEGYVLQDMGKDALILWSRDNSINVVDKKIIDYQESDLLVDMRKTTCTNKQDIAQLKDSIKINQIKITNMQDSNQAIKDVQDTLSSLHVKVQNVKDDFDEFKRFVMTYVEEEKNNRKAMIEVLEQLKINQSYGENSPKRKKHA